MRRSLAGRRHSPDTLEGAISASPHRPPRPSNHPPFLGNLAERYPAGKNTLGFAGAGEAAAPAEHRRGPGVRQGCNLRGE